MLFQHTWRKVLLGEKTQTRRLRYNGELLFPSDKHNYRAGETKGVESPLGKVKWQVGQTFAVQPGRTQRAVWWRNLGGELQSIYNEDCPASVRAWSDSMLRAHAFRQLRIRITDIRREDVRNISFEDACAEGFHDKDPVAVVADTVYGGFLKTWCKMHDKKAVWEFDPQRVDYWINTGKRRELVGFDTVKDIIANRPAERYDAWVLTLELVKD